MNFVINLEITKILLTKLEVTGWPIYIVLAESQKFKVFHEKLF